MNSLVRPKKAIPDDAISIHGITNEAVAGAPSWAALYGEFYRLIENKVVVIYNEDFDVRLLAQTAILPVHSAFLIQTFCIPLILLNNSPNQITQALRIGVAQGLDCLDAGHAQDLPDMPLINALALQLHSKGTAA